MSSNGDLRSAPSMFQRRFYSVRPERRSINGRSRMIVHVSVRSSKSTRPPRRPSRSFNVDVRSVSVGSSRTLRRPTGQYRPLARSVGTAWMHENANRQSIRWTHDQSVKRRESLFDPSVQSMAKKNKNDRSRSNIKDLTEHSKTSRNRKRKCDARCSYPCVLLSILVGLLLGIGLAAGLLALLFKPSKTSTSISTTTPTTPATIFLTSITLTTVTETTTTTITTGVTSSTTTASTTITTITTSVTMTTSETTTTETTSSTTTETTTSCNTPTSTILSYSSGPSPFTYQTYNFTASFTGLGLLEFGFFSQSGNHFWFLDDVMIIDLSTSSSSLLANGGFEIGNLSGWQLICASQCQSASGAVVSSSPKRGSFTYKDACKQRYDFLRQMFPMTTGHLYMLSFWLDSDQNNGQTAFVNIS